MKNIYAIAAGMCTSLRYGDNFQAVLLTNAMHEIQRFAQAQSDIARDTTQSGYLGDVLVTAYSNEVGRTERSVIGSKDRINATIGDTILIFRRFCRFDDESQL